MNAGPKLAGCAAAIAALGGCYSQRPLASPVPAPATRIIAQLTDSGAVAVGNAVGPGAVAVEGIVAHVDNGVWALNLLRVEHRGGSSVVWNQERVVIPRSALTDVTERRLDRKRSWLAAGLVVGGAIAMSKVFQQMGGEETPIIEPPPASARLPR